MQKETLFVCAECGLHYRDEKTADQCRQWCLQNNSCNMAITRFSVERSKKMEADQRPEGETRVFDRKAHWEKIYAEKKPGEMSWYQEDPAMSLRLIEERGLSPENRLIDVGGGASVLVDRLLEKRYQHVTVLDISENALRHAQARLGASGNNVTWVVDDVTKFTVSEPYHLWHDRAVFHFLTDEEDRKAYVAKAYQALVKGGVLIVASFAMDGPTQCSNLPVQQYDAESIRRPFGEKFEFLREEGELHRTPWGKDQKFGYFIFRKKAE